MCEAGPRVLLVPFHSSPCIPGSPFRGRPLPPMNLPPFVAFYLLAASEGAEDEHRTRVTKTLVPVLVAGLATMQLAGLWRSSLLTLYQQQVSIGPPLADTLPWGRSWMHRGSLISLRCLEIPCTNHNTIIMDPVPKSKVSRRIPHDLACRTSTGTRRSRMPSSCRTPTSISTHKTTMSVHS